jgi:hypothetical protein
MDEITISAGLVANANSNQNNGIAVANSNSTVSLRSQLARFNS